LERCIHVTIHAGETESVDNIWQAVYHLSADRIGHGLKLLDKPELIPRFIDKNIGIEMCPSSNDQIIGYLCAEHAYPLKNIWKKDSR
jgi:adenosine deaminase